MKPLSQHIQENMSDDTSTLKEDILDKVVGDRKDEEKPSAE